MSGEVLVHSCHARTDIRRKEYLNPNRLYYSDDHKFEFFKALPLKCRCKKVVTRIVAELYLAQGKAFKVYRPKEDGPLDDKCVEEKHIVLPVERSQTPRVDLITKADVERAYNGLSHPDKRDQEFMAHIEAIHDMILLERAKLVVPFQEDPDAMYDEKGLPFAGRILFAFGPDQRTRGGH